MAHTSGDPRTNNPPDPNSSFSTSSFTMGSASPTANHGPPFHIFFRILLLLSLKAACTITSVPSPGLTSACNNCTAQPHLSSRSKRQMHSATPQETVYIFHDDDGKAGRVCVTIIRRRRLLDKVFEVLVPIERDQVMSRSPRYGVHAIVIPACRSQQAESSKQVSAG